MEMGVSATFMVRVLFSLMISILFMQSGLDKILNWKAEKDFYREHFSKSILKNTIPFLMPVITISESMTGLLSVLGLIVYVSGGSTDLAILGMLLACLSIVQLFLGQRIAKDYAGAATLVPYFLMAVAGLYVYIN